MNPKHVESISNNRKAFALYNFVQLSTKIFLTVAQPSPQMKFGSYSGSSKAEKPKRSPKKGT